jgi:hypothetical protein
MMQHLPSTSLHEILLILSLTVCEKTTINRPSGDDPRQKIHDADPNQLTLFS